MSAPGGEGKPLASWEVGVPHGVDLIVLDTAPLWLSGRIAQEGRLLFNDDPPTRVRWQAETRLRYLDEIPAVRERYCRVGSSWPIGCRMVDQERLDRLLDRVASDLKVLDGYRTAEGDLLDDPTRLAAVKYPRILHRQEEHLCYFELREHCRATRAAATGI